jgi:hypothetical protein
MRMARQLGLAVSTILLAILLVAAIAIVIANASRGGPAQSAQQQARLDATTLINQAQNLKTGFDKMVADGIGPAAFTFDNVPGTGLWTPSVGGTVAQRDLPPSGTTGRGAYYKWIYHGPGAELKLMNVGSAAGNYAVMGHYLTNATCQQINYLLWGSTTIPRTSSTQDTTAWAMVDYATDPATNERPEQCMATVGGPNFYYTVVYQQ